MPRNILIDPQRLGTSNPNIQFSGSLGNTIKLEVLTSGSVQFTGVSGSLLSVVDSLSGSLFAVSDISGLPILEAFSDDRVVMGRFNTNAFVVTGSFVGIGTSAPIAKLHIIGASTYNSDTVKALRVGDSATLTKGVDIGYDTTLDRGFIQAGNFTFSYKDLLLNPNLGNIGVGVTNPNSKLTIGKDFASVAGVTIHAGDVADSAIVARNGDSKTVFSVLPWGDTVYIGSGIYYDGGSWVHANSNTNNQLFNLYPGLGAQWYASNDGAASWNVATGVLLWDSAASWKSSVQSTRAVASYFTGGSLGIGTTNPTQKLAIESSGDPTVDNNSSAISLRNTFSSRAAVIGYSNAQNLLIWNSNSASTTLTGSIIFLRSTGTGTESMRIDGSGNVGIGTVPDSKLHVAVSSTNSMRIGYAGGFENYFDASAHYWRDTSANMAMLIDGSRNVGIGTTGNVSARLHVRGSTTTTTPTVLIQESQSMVNGTATLSVQNASGTPLLFVSGSGNVGIGTNIPRTKIHTWSDSTGPNIEVARFTSAYAAGGDGPLLRFTNYLSYATNPNAGEYNLAGIRAYDYNASWGGTLQFLTAVSTGGGGALTAAMTINPVQNIGVSTATPSARFHIIGSTVTTTPTLLIRESQAMANATATLDVQNSAGTSLFFVSGSGNIGVGTNNPVNFGAGYANFAVNGTTTGVFEVMQNGSSALRLYSDGSTAFIQTIGSRALVLSTPSERIRIDSLGNVGIGITTTTDRLAVAGSMSVTGSLLPGGSNSHNLGSTTKLWSNVYATALTGSLTRLADGTSAFIAGANVSITTGSNGAVTINASLSGGAVSGTGTVNYIPKWTTTTNIANSVIYDDGTNIAIGTTTPTTNNRITLVGGGMIINGAGQLHLNGNQSAMVGASRRLNYGDLLLGYNIRGQNGDDNYYTHNSHAAAGYGGIDLQYQGQIKFYSFSGAVTAGASVTPNIIGQFNTTAMWLSPRATSGDFYIDSSGNVGIGTSTFGAHLTISRPATTTTGQLELRTVGGISDGNFDGIYFTQGASGTTALGSIRMVNRSSGNPDFAIYTRVPGGSTESEKIKILNAGNLGIGHTNPTAILHISGSISTTAPGLDIRLQESTASTLILRNLSVGNYQTRYTTIDFYNAFSGGDGYQTGRIYNSFLTGGNWTDVAIRFQVPNSVGTLTDTLTIRNTHVAVGNAFAGTATPNVRFHVSGSSTSSDQTMLVVAGVPNPAGPVFEVENNNGGTLFIVSGSGNVGVGSALPGKLLDVAGEIRGTTKLTVTSGVTESAISVQGSTADLGIEIANAGMSGRNYQLLSSNLSSTTPGCFKIRNATIGTDYLIITNTGYVGVGSTATIPARLYVSGSDITADGTMHIRAGTPGQTGPVFRADNSVGTALMFLDPNGSLGIGTGTPSNTLDVNGTVRVRSVSNATGNFATYSATGVLQQRTAAEVKTDLSLNNVQNLTVSQIFNNTGLNHTTRTDFASITDFGYQYVQGATNGPGVNGASQYYAWSIGLGNDYAYSSYAAQFALPRDGSGNPYMSVRRREGGTWGSWLKLAAGNADTLTTSRTINGTSFDGSGNITVPVNTAQASNSASYHLTFVAATTAGNQQLYTDSASELTYNPSTNVLTTTTFAGALSGNATTATTLQTARNINGTSFNGSADITVPVNTSQKSDNVSYNIPFVSSVTAGNQSLYTDSAAELTYNPSTNTLTTTTFAGALSGNSTTATTLQNARTLWGQSFNGSANISGDITGVGTAITANAAVTLTATNADLGLTATGTNNINANVGGSTRLTINSTGVSIPSATANLAVGATAQANTRLYVLGTSTATDTTVYVQHNVVNGSNLAVLDVRNSGAQSLLFVSGSAITTAGVGTATPQGKFHVEGNSVPGSIPTLFVRHGTSTDVSVVDVRNAASNPLLIISGSGNVGIGTLGAKSKLHVYGNGQLTANLTDAGNRGSLLRLTHDDSNVGAGGGILFANIQGDAVNSIGFAAIKGLLQDGGTNTRGHIAFSTRNAVTDTALTERMRITYDGNVGIGTTSPMANANYGGLTINGTSGAIISNMVNGTEAFKIQTDATTHSINGVSNIAMRFMTNNTEAMRIDSSQRIGIGTSTISGARTIISGSTTGSDTTLLVRHGIRNGSNLPILDLQNSVGTSILFVSGSGRVGVGVTNPSATLSVACGTTQARINEIYTNYAGIILNGSTVGDEYNLISSPSDKNLFINRPTGYSIRFRENNGDQVYIDTGGTMYTQTIYPRADATYSLGYYGFGTISWAYVSSYAYYNPSDYRLKTNVIPVSGSLEKISLLRPVTYEYDSISLQNTGHANTRAGFIAHELEEHFPQLVIGKKDAVDERTGKLMPQMIIKDDIIPYVVDAIKELKLENDMLKSELQSIKQQISSILDLLNNK